MPHWREPDPRGDEHPPWDSIIGFVLLMAMLGGVWLLSRYWHS